MNMYINLNAKRKKNQRKKNQTEFKNLIDSKSLINIEHYPLLLLLENYYIFSFTKLEYQKTQ